MHVRLEVGTPARRGEGEMRTVGPIERAKSQNLPKITHFFMTFCVLTRGANGKRLSE